jgi:DNA-binding CsgD family transcriptional regulator
MRNSLDDPSQARQQVRAVLTLAERLLGQPLPAVRAGSTSSELRQVLAQAARAVENAMRTTPPEAGEGLAVLRALGLQLRFVAGSLGPGNHLDEPCDVRGVLADVELAMRRLRTMSTVSELTAHAPAELGRLGFTRVLMSQIEEGLWITQSAYARGDKALAGALVSAGQQHPRRLSAELYETQMVRRGQPILVRHPRGSSHVHTELVSITQTRAYVAAPLSRGNLVCGLLHADKDGDAGQVTDRDQQILAVFGEGLGQALDRAVCFQRMRRLKDQLETQLSSAGDLIDEFLATESAAPVPRATPSSGVISEGGPASGRAAAQLKPPTAPRMTGRELDILTALVDGKTNAQIAQRLFVSESTVKYHVRNILRKMNANNRADAVARFLRS